jgi:hypothetical protein
MSATGRTREDGLETRRLDDDDYETPAWCVRAVWPHVRPITGTVLEPCAGRGAIVEALRDGVNGHSFWTPHSVHARELDDVRCARIGTANKICCDWLSYAETLRPALVITNPPYKLALEFATKAIALQQPHGGAVCMLLRLNFLGSQKRGAWLRDHIPDVYVLSRRPSFCTYVHHRFVAHPRTEQEKASMRWWTAFRAVKVGVPEEIAGLRADLKSDSWKGVVPPSRIRAIEEWCARLPGWDSQPLVFRSGTDATEYAWFVWGPRQRGRIHILEDRQ